jgi:hypothetical protein
MGEMKMARRGWRVIKLDIGIPVAEGDDAVGRWQSVNNKLHYIT